MGNSDLQHGLVRWVQNYGEHILKILMARSPKLHHSRRLSNPIATPLYQNGHAGPGSPRQGPTRQDSGGKPRRFGGGVRVGGGGMLQPPFSAFPYSFNMGNSPTNSFYNMGIIPNHGQLSPPTGTNAMTTPTNNAGGVPGYHGVIMQVPPGIPSPSSQAGGQGGLMYIQGPPPPVAVVQQPPSVDSPNHHLSSTQPSSPTISAPPGVGGVAKSEGGGGGEGLYLPPQSQNLIPAMNPLMATSALPPTATIAGPHPPHPPLNPGGPHPPLNPGGPGGGASTGQFEHVQGMPHLSAANSSMFPLADSASISANQFPPTHPPPLSVNTPLPPPLHPALTHTPGHAPLGESEPLLPNPPIPPIPFLPMVHQIQGTHPQPPISTGNGALFHGQQPPPPPDSSSPLSSRKEILCRHFVHGNCPFGEKCWFAHLEPPGGIGQPPRHEGPGGQGMGTPLQVQVPQKFWLGGPMLDYAAMASPPQSPMNPAFVPRPPIMPAVFRPRGGIPYSNQPLLFLRGPIPGNPRMHGSNLPLMQPSIPMPLNPILKFGLLSQVVLQGMEGQPSPMTYITQLGTYADHFFVSYGSNINTYRIIFGGNRNYQESAVPTEKKKLENRVSCLVCSQQQPMLLLVGTEEGNVSLLDMRKGAGHGNVTPVYCNETPSPAESITALIHFSTSINSAQVVVTGSLSGVLAWHIAQPPQKTFSLLYLDKDTHSPNKIISLQMLGGFLVSGDTSGKVAVWSMMSQTPSTHSVLNTHSLSMTNLHVVDANHFITVGTDVQLASEETSLSSISKLQATPPDDPFNIVPPSGLEDLSVDMSQLSVQSADEESSLTASAASNATAADSPAQYVIKFWEYGKPPKLMRDISEVGHVLSSSFHCHNPPGNMFLGLGIADGMIKIYNVPNFTISSELYFPEMKGKDCIHVRLNLSREAPLITPAYYRNPFRDLILTSLWSDGKIMVCQVAKQ